MNDQDNYKQGDIKQGNEQSIWPRVLYMILFAIAFSISETVMLLVAVVNLVFKIVKKDTHKGLLTFGGSLSNYLQQIARYLTFNTEYLPFPFNQWPSNTSNGNSQNGDPTASDEEAHA